MRKRFPRRIRQTAAVLACAACLAHAQAFDAASVKPTAGGRPDPTGGPGTQDPGRIHYPNLSLQYLLQIAYEVPSFQLSGPDWLDAERFDVDAVLPAETTAPQFHVMLQNLLVDRFRLKLHRENHQLSGYALLAQPGAMKLKESVEDLGPGDSAPLPLQPGKDGFFVPPRRPGVFLQLAGMTAARETFRQTTMRELAESVQGQILRPVTDATGLSGKYDFTLTFATEGLFMGRGRLPVNPATLENPPDLLHALRSELGLRLEPRKIPVEILVIDHAEKVPTRN